jgi:hypothetical protein
MAFDAEAVAVDDTVTLVYTFSSEIQSVVIQNHSASTSPIELIGPANVFGDGVTLAAGDSLPVKGLTNESVYAICDTAGTADVRVLKQGI